MFFQKLFRHFLVVSVFINVSFFSAKAEVFFRENKGQVKDQNWQPRPDVLYSYDDGPLHVHLKKDGLHYQLYKALSWKQDDEQGSKRKVIDSLGIYRVDVQWLNTNKNVQVEKGNDLAGYENFYNVPDGADPALFVKRYEKLIYKNIYNNIDLHFFEGKHGGLEYDYIVQPGANYHNIQWKINGASLRVNDKKELILKTPYGEIVEGALLVLQGDKKIDAEWVLKGNVVSVHITGVYDKAKPLRIDPPVRLWGTYYAGTGLDALLSCVEDAAGNVYAAGDASANNMATSGAHQTVFAAGSADGLLAKFNTNGQRLWATYYGGNFADRGKACGVDASGNVYLMGVTQSDNGIASAGAYQATRGGGSDVFIAKFNSTGVRQWGTYFGGTSGDDGKSAVVDAAGNVYVCGNASYTSAALASAGAHQVGYAGGLGQDCFLAKFNTSGQRVWGTYYGGSADDRPGGCAVDATGNVYLAGWTSSATAIATAGAHQTVLNNQGDAFLVKFDNNGVRQWGTYYGGTQEERGVSCGTDGAGNVYLLGRTNSTSLIATVGTHQSNFAGDYDAFVVKFNGTNGTRLWGTYYGGTGNEEPEFLHTNSAGDILITGETVSATLIATATAHQTTNAGGSDGFLGLFSTNGQRTWGTYYGGANFEEGRSCHIGASGFYYMCGLADSPTGIATPGTYQSNGGGSGFLAKFEACVPPAAPTATGTTICGGQTASLTASAPSGVTFNWFAASTGGTALGTGATFTTPTLNATTTYYVEAVATGCPPSTRTAVTVTVTPAPAAPIANTLTPGVCRDSAATFQVTSTGTTFNWYATANSTTILGTGTTFTSPPLQNSTSYFVERVENGCPSPRTQVFVQVITAPDPTPANTQICAGTTATLNSNLISGTVNWYNAPNATTAIFTGLTFTTPVLNANTTYYVQNFVNGCPSTRVPVTVTVVTPPAAPTVNGATICAGQTATLNATAPSGVTFGWFTNATGGTAVFTGNPFTTPTLNNNTTYYVEAQAGTCNSSRTAFTVTVNPSPAAAIANTLTPGVCRDSAASFQVTSIGTTFNWYATNTSTTILGTGTTFTSPPLQNSASYFIERVENGCPSQRTQVFVQVVTAPDPTPANTSICAGTTATLNSNLTTGTVNWYNAPGATTPLFTGFSFTTPVLNANTTYYVQNFVNGCPSARVPVTVTVVTPPAAPTVNGATICAGQTATLNTTAPTGVTFAWFTQASGGTAVFTGNPFTTPTLNNNITYYVEAQAGTCNSSRAAVTVTVNTSPAAPIANTLTPGVCKDSVATFQVTSTGTTFNWYATNTSTTILGTGITFTSPALTASTSYFVERVENSCPSPRTQVFVQVITAPDPTPANTQICAGTTATLNSNLTSGTVNWYNSPNATTSIFTGFSYTTPVLNANTTYYVQNFVSGCPSARVPVTVNVVNPPAAPTVSGTSICSGQTATLNATAPSGVTFAWFTATTGGTAIFTGNSFSTPVLNSNTTYFVESQVGTCNSPTRTSVDVVVNSSPIVNVSSNSPICEGSDLSLTVNATTNASYAWSGPNGFTSSQQNPTIIGAGVNASGNYSVTVSANGCSTNGSLAVAVNPLPIINTNYSSPLCEGSDLNLTASSTINAAYSWSGPNGYSSAQQNPTITSVQLLNAGNYSVTVTSAQNCTAAGSVNVIVNSASGLFISAATNPPLICVGENTTLSATGGSSYNWSDGLGTDAVLTVSPSSTSTYFVTATDATTGCSAVATTSVTVNPLPTITINTSQTTLCEAGSATLTASGADSYVWNTSETMAIINVSPTSTTSYTVTGTDANGCSSTASQNINVLNFTTPQFTISNSITLCYGNNAPTLPSTSTNGITGVWQPSTISNTQSNNYTFTPDGGQCASTYDVNVIVQQINMTAGPDTLVELASQVELFAAVSGSTNGTYIWSPAENINCFNCSNPILLALRDQVYTVTYTDLQTGCSASASVNIDVNYDPNTIFFIPNAFSPNGDGNNDVFEVYGLKIREIDMRIYNRWGEKVFEDKSASPKWDGTYKGVLQNPDVFIYHTFIIFFNNQVVQTKGSVTIIR